MVPSNVFEYITSSGGNFVGTTKRANACWPFTYNQKVKEGDKRTHVEIFGAPTLFVKKLVRQGKTISAVAFRNGSDAVSTAVSSIHQGHHWDGIAVYTKEKIEYSRDPSLLKVDFFRRVDKPNGFFPRILPEVVESPLVAELEHMVDFVTLRQGEFTSSRY